MAELEIHHEHGGAEDPLGRRIGVLTSILAVMLAVVTILSHRAHTAGVLIKADANDKWSYYQSKRIKFHDLELGKDLMEVIAPRTAEISTKLVRYEGELKRYRKEGDEVQAEAKAMEAKVDELEKRALRYDFGEGLLEISLVLSSLYFIAKKVYFPMIGLIAGISGAAIALSGYLLG